MRALAEKKDLHVHFHGPRDHLDSSIHEYQVRRARARRRALSRPRRAPPPPGHSGTGLEAARTAAARGAVRLGVSPGAPTPAALL